MYFGFPPCDAGRRSRGPHFPFVLCYPGFPRYEFRGVWVQGARYVIRARSSYLQLLVHPISSHFQELIESFKGRAVNGYPRTCGTIDKFDNLLANESMIGSSDESSLLGKTASEEGSDDALDKYLSMQTDWMHEELGIGGASSDDTPSTLNPDAPEFVP